MLPAHYLKQLNFIEISLYILIGGFVTALEYAADTTAEVVGKPEKTFFYEAIRDLNVDPQNTVMIGDVSIRTHTI